MAAKRLKARGYQLPPGPRGDAAGGISTPGHPRGNRTGDMRMANNWTSNVRRYPSAPFGRYEDGSPLPENFDRPGGRAVPNARRPRRQSVIPRGGTNFGERGGAFRKQKGWNS
jgi:hypothetical protein